MKHILVCFYENYNNPVETKIPNEFRTVLVTPLYGQESINGYTHDIQWNFTTGFLTIKAKENSRKTFGYNFYHYGCI